MHKAHSTIGWYTWEQSQKKITINLNNELVFFMYQTTNIFEKNMTECCWVWYNIVKWKSVSYSGKQLPSMHQKVCDPMTTQGKDP